MPGITMKATFPIFYKIPITTALVNAISMGEYLKQETVVYAHSPELPRLTFHGEKEMQVLENRTLILSCYEAFKQFINYHQE